MATLERQLQQKLRLLGRGVEALEEREGSAEGSCPRDRELEPDPVSLWEGVAVLALLVTFSSAASLWLFSSLGRQVGERACDVMFDQLLFM